MGDYTTWTNNELVNLLKLNLGVMSGGLTALLGDAPLPDIRDMFEHVKDISTDDLMQSMFDDRDEIQKNMDVTELIVKVQGENIQIQKELLSRIPS